MKPFLTAAMIVVLTLATPGALGASAATPTPDATSCVAASRLVLQQVTSSLPPVCDGTLSTVEISPGRSFVIPARGNSVSFSAVTVQGAVAVPDVVVARSTDGRLAVQFGEVGQPGLRTFGAAEVLSEFSAATVSAGGQAVLLATNPKCDLSTYSVNTYRWITTYQWRFRPTAFGGQASIAAAIQAMANGTGACGVNVQNGATASYLGTTSTQSSVNSNNTCAIGDTTNVVDSGPLPSGTLAATCTYKTPSEIFAADIKISTSYSWYTGTSLTGCSGSNYDLQGVMTHEAGHAFGLNHVVQTSAQVMKPNISTCETSMRKLGTGDLAGMKYLYP